MDEPTIFGPGDRVGVLVPAPLPGPLDYAVPAGMHLAIGDLVGVELGARRVVGAVWGAGTGETPPARLKPVLDRLAVPAIGAAMRRFLDRAAAYTMTPPGLMLRLALRVPDLGRPPRRRTVYRPGSTTPARPTPARARVLAAVAAAPERGWSAAELAAEAGASPAVIRALAAAGALDAREEAVAEAPYLPLFGQAPGQHLGAAQAGAAARLRADVAAGGFRPTLLYGVTGSGKTEVYLEAVAECAAKGRQALVLLPEVALTPGFLERVESRFGARPGAWHHGVPAAERRRLWSAAAAGTVPLVVGARSALFLPFRDLGLIVVDEEHEPSFKQEDGVLYHARDMAVLRAAEEGVAVVLASATPSLETWTNAEAGKYARIDLPERFGAAVMPDIRLIDLRRDAPGRDRWISEPLVEAVRARLGRGEQAMLFLNRRGYAPLTLCRACGHMIGCPHCDARLVEHRLRGRLLCHQCGHEEGLARACPECGRDDRLAAAGPGVERIAEEVAALFPDARVTVLSSDMVGGPEALADRLAAIAAGETDIVIGTQMVAKGHNFPALTLVGVIDADLGLRGGDLRAAERSFQVLAQVAGRAGRADRPGTALIQTASPDHPVMAALVSGKAEAFWAAEAEERRAARSPPFARMAGIVVSGTQEDRVWEVARALGRARGPLDAAGVDLFGPAPAPIARIRGRARVRLLARAERGIAIQHALRAWLAGVRVASSVRVAVDIDPQSFL